MGVVKEGRRKSGGRGKSGGKKVVGVGRGA